MASETILDMEQKKMNLRLAWSLGAIAILIFISSVPFWQGLWKIALQQN